MDDGPIERIRSAWRDLRAQEIPLHPVKLAALIWRAMITEHSSPGRLAWAVGVGVFIGCIPVLGIHLASILLVGFIFRLNKLVAWLSANISNPLFAPFLIFTEIQVGYLVMTGRFAPLRYAELREHGWRQSIELFFVNALVGSVVVGLVLGTVAGLIAYAALLRRQRRRDATATATAETGDPG
jgi:uncharacterized protein (DUF2062 family)